MDLNITSPVVMQDNSLIKLVEEIEERFKRLGTIKMGTTDNINVFFQDNNNLYLEESNYQQPKKED